MKTIKRVVCWFSCGATSAVATKLTINKYKGQYPVVIAYCDTGSEHPDNIRFLKDCEKWYGQEINKLKSKKFSNVLDVWDETGYIAGISGAKCSFELKKRVREQFEDIEFDLQVFGFDVKEKKRAERFLSNNPLIMCEFPLIEQNIGKSKCLMMLRYAGIEIPAMYLLGYKNNNCIGCVKGGTGYWNKIKKDFPEEFAKINEYERKYGVRLTKITVDGEVRRIFLDELPEDVGNYRSELPITCGFVCE